jgi:hypothetical protein
MVSKGKMMTMTGLFYLFIFRFYKERPNHVKDRLLFFSFPIARCGLAATSVEAEGLEN